MTTLADPPRTESAVEATGLAVGYGTRPVLHGVDLHAVRGSVTALIGPNGSGKSTLLKACARLLRPTGGTVLLDGHDLATLPSRDIARRMAVLPQAPSAPAHLTVRELVEQGRFPHAGMLRMLRRQDHEAIDEAVRATHLENLLHRDVDTLSGGERQRAWIALTLAQQAPILLLDEPTTFLDIGHQLEVLELVRHLNTTRGMTIVMVLHDLNQAAQFADHLMVLDAGRVVRSGEPAAVLTADLLRDVFRVVAHISTDATGRPVCVPLRSTRAEAAGPDPATS